MSDNVIKKFETEMQDFKDRLEVLETKIQNLEKIPEELEKLKSALIEVLVISVSVLDIDSSVHDFVLLADKVSVSVEVVETLIRTHLKSMKKLVKTYDKEPFKEAISDYMKRWASLIFTVASIKEIKFDDFCSIVIESLGSDLAKKSIALEDVVKFYGTENASRWKKLIE